MKQVCKGCDHLKRSHSSWGMFVCDVKGCDCNVPLGDI